jgi:hypothetical protein
VFEERLVGVVATAAAAEELRLGGLLAGGELGGKEEAAMMMELSIILFHLQKQIMDSNSCLFSRTNL